MALSSLATDYAGTRTRLFWLALKASILTVLTLGFYRFWMKTRLRRFYWSAIRPGGVPLEYTGTGVEKLMGFLIAVVFLAFYIGVFNLILIFFSFSLLSTSFAAYLLSFVGIIPIFFYARYRARRYILARTRWRGMRFGAESAAWSYAWRAMLHWLATILTLGLLLPRQIFKLEKFRTDRTWYGNARFHQEGRWTMLLPVAKHYYFGLLISLTSGVAGYFEPVALLTLTPALVWLIIGFVHLNVQGFRLLTEHKRLNERIAFTSAPRTRRILRIYALGNMLVSAILFTLIVVIFVAIGFFLATFGPGSFEGEFELVPSLGSGWRDQLVFIGFAIAYFSMFILYSVLTQVFVTLPIMAHYAETLQIEKPHLLGEIDQRDRDDMTEAEGFAEALDIGAAI